MFIHIFTPIYCVHRLTILFFFLYCSNQTSCTIRSSRRKRNIPIIVRVSDVNDNAPVFVNTPYQTTVPEVSTTSNARFITVLPSAHSHTLGSTHTDAATATRTRVRWRGVRVSNIITINKKSRRRKKLVVLNNNCGVCKGMRHFMGRPANVCRRTRTLCK